MLLLKPVREPRRKIRSFAATPLLRMYIDPLQLSVASEAPCEMSGNIANHSVPLVSYVNHSRRQGMLRMELAIEISHQALLGLASFALSMPHIAAMCGMSALCACR
jgi:hypothetical protein